MAAKRRGVTCDATRHGSLFIGIEIDDLVPQLAYAAALNEGRIEQDHGVRRRDGPVFGDAVRSEVVHPHGILSGPTRPEWSQHLVDERVEVVRIFVVAAS
jgi:hypothetical protein